MGDAMGVPDPGFMIDTSKVADIAQMLNDLVSEMSGAYAYFGANASITGTPDFMGDLLGKLDPANSGTVPGPEIAEAWVHFFDVWGQYLDEMVGALTEVQSAATTTGTTYATKNQAVDQAMKALNTSGYDFSHLTTLTAPPVAAENDQADKNKWSWLTTKVPPQNPSGQ